MCACTAKKRLAAPVRAASPATATMRPERIRSYGNDLSTDIWLAHSTKKYHFGVAYIWLMVNTTDRNPNRQWADRTRACQCGYAFRLSTGALVSPACLA